MIGDEEEGIIKERERERERRPLGVKENKKREQVLGRWSGEEKEVSSYANRFFRIGTGAPS